MEDEAENGGRGEGEEMQPTLCGGHFLAGLSFLNLWTTVAPSSQDLSKAMLFPEEVSVIWKGRRM